ncbi:MAG: hypothetical protein M9928_07575 [Anaerolineae bacterium]|nr:hypothetical protein [Anaerolineae bacterium]
MTDSLWIFFFIIVASITIVAMPVMISWLVWLIQTPRDRIAIRTFVATTTYEHVRTKLRDRKHTHSGTPGRTYNVALYDGAGTLYEQLVSIGAGNELIAGERRAIFTPHRRRKSRSMLERFRPKIAPALTKEEMLNGLTSPLASQRRSMLDAIALLSRLPAPVSNAVAEIAATDPEPDIQAQAKAVLKPFELQARFEMSD